MDPVGHLTTWGSHPRWLVERWLVRWSWEDVLALVELDNRAPPLVVMPLDLSADEAVERLGEAGVSAREVGHGTGAVEVTGDASPSQVLQLVSAVVQDPGAALVPLYADAPEGGLIADLCAAPGGKTLALTRGGAYVLAADRSPRRLRILRENLARTGRRAGTVVALAEAPPLRRADLVLLDVPCTGTGTLRRHPDARWRLKPWDIERMAGVQARILDGAQVVVPEGGLLVYSTCTLEPEENEEQVAEFLSRHGDFRLEPTGSVEPALMEGGSLRVLPQRTGFDGSFAARLRRGG
jgi:16S rRNA (cytosine967-C5)-methyltransferase